MKIGGTKQMNIVDYFILAVLGISTIMGIYQGFVVAILNIASFFVSWLTAFLLYPILAHYLQASTKIVSTLLYYTEASTKIPGIEYRNAVITAIPAEKMKEIVQNADFPTPFDSILHNNIINQVFRQSGLTTLGDYFNHTIVNVIINILSFLAIYLVIRILLSLIISMTDTIAHLPVLKHFNSLLGGAFGLFRGIFTIFIIFAIIPVILTVIPLDLKTMFLDKSLFAAFFYKSNIITNIINGII